MVLFVTLLLLFSPLQNESAKQRDFCRNLHHIIESGKMDNFESIMATSDHVSPFLRMPGQSMHLEHFPIFYVDKDNRFVAKTNLNLDSLSAVKKLGQLQETIKACIDTTQWTWLAFKGEDPATAFFKEISEEVAVGKELTLTLAMVAVADKVYSVNLYIHKNKR